MIIKKSIKINAAYPIKNLNSVKAGASPDPNGCGPKCKVDGKECRNVSWAGDIAYSLSNIQVMIV